MTQSLILRFVVDTSHNFVDSNVGMDQLVYVRSYINTTVEMPRCYVPSTQH
jgi:hypothetical protein